VSASSRLRVGIEVPTTEGRQLLLRPLAGGDGVQLAIIGKRGGLVEAVGIALEQTMPLLQHLDAMSEVAWQVRERQSKRDRRAKERRHRAALESNPWLKKPGRAETTTTYVVRPR
jgi:hypothetical protein